MSGEWNSITLLISITAAILAFGISLLAYATKIASLSGIVALFIVFAGSYLAFGLPGYAYAAIILAGSSLVTKFRYETKKKKGIAEPGRGARDFWRIMGGAGAGCLVAWVTVGGVLGNHVGGCGFAVSLAITNSDTWASEIGILSRNKPRLSVPPWQHIDAGVSGAVSALGEVAGVAGVLFAVLASYGIGLLGTGFSVLLAAVLIAILGEHLDSFIGALLQESYFCVNCSEYTDRRIHSCGAATKPVRGLRFVTNTRVNFISTLLGGLVAILVVGALSR